MSGGHPQSPETRAKISLAHKGKKVSEEVCRKISLAKTGKPGHRHSEETKRKMSLARKGRPCSQDQIDRLRRNNLNRGSVSQETRDKLSKAGKGRKKSAEHRRKIGEAHKGKKLAPLSEERKRQISEQQRGRKHSEEHIRKVSEGLIRWLKSNPNKYGNSSIEVPIKAELDRRRVSYNTQVRVDRYVVDIILPEHQIAIECDGCYWHSCPECNHARPEEAKQKIREKDERKARSIVRSGYRLFRFWEHDIRKSAAVCIDKLGLSSYGKV